MRINSQTGLWYIPYDQTSFELVDYADGTAAVKAHLASGNSLIIGIYEDRHAADIVIERIIAAANFGESDVFYVPEDKYFWTKECEKLGEEIDAEAREAVDALIAEGVEV